jgi:biotin carboxylase
MTTSRNFDDPASIDFDDPASIGSGRPPTVLVLGASVSQVTAIRRAHELGFRTVAVDGDPAAVGFAYAQISEAVDFSDIAAVIEVARRHHIDGVVAISTDRAVPVAAAVAETLGLPGTNFEVASRMTDKGLMRRCLAAAGLPQPAFAVIDSGSDIQGVLASIGTPAVLKPVDSGGQRGLFLVETLDQLRRVLPLTLSFSRAGRAILERFVAGSELNAMAVVVRGKPKVLTLSDRLRPPGPGFGVGWIHLYPSTLNKDVLDQAAEVARQAITALGLRDGIAFPQLLVDGDNVVVVEVAARIAAGQMADLVYHGIGVDLTTVALHQCLGRRIDPSLIKPRSSRPIAIRFLTASPGPLPLGRVIAIDGLDRVRASPGILDAGLYLQLGETIKPVQVDFDRRGYIIATDKNQLAALDLADIAAKHLHLDVEHATELSSSPTPE